ncbi:FtsX-like permease family protein [Micromonospora haikouensis]|uniref:FtsX-like permease family protein n=1 Tax=Micromonospora haikouensis TaxID=686309 RepID=A0A1C4W132_9ACTN|nr:FtsX-like permease family protein [Micromonospora haikouensis]SCE89937.1 FtsX-like permease family protein [Micromonospora haikouensis]
MRPGTLGRLALAGTRTDAVRVVLTALSAALAALAGLAALTVLAIPTPPATDDNEVRWSLQYATALLREPGLRGGTAFALLLLALPVLALAGQCARLGAPARDRRLAALRLAGATPGQVTRLAALETGVASLLGTVGGLVVFLVAHELLDRPGADGRLALPTDVLPSPVALAATVLGLPAVAAVATALLLRRVVTTPFGVVRRARRDRPPRPWFALLVPAGVGSFAGYFPLLHWLERHEVQALLPYLPILVAVGGLAALVGTVLAAGWFSYAAGRLLHRLAQGPAALLAARRLAADPWAGSRTFAALLAAVLFGGGAAAFRAHFQARYAAELAEARTFGDVTSAGDTFYLDTIGLVDLAVAAAVTIAAGGLLVALVEGIVARRRAYAALVAQGVPRGVLGRSVAWQALAPAVPAVLLALTVGLLLGRFLSGPVRTGGSGYVCEAAAAICADPAARGPYLRLVEAPERYVMPGVPLEQLALVGAGAVAAVALTVAVGLLFLQASTTVEELRAT